jgi:cytochrome c
MLRGGLFSAMLVISASSAPAETFSEDEIIDIARNAGVDPAPLMLAGDLEYGAYLSGECVTCHQADGTQAGIPGIAGWNDVIFKLTMQEYKLKLRSDHVMQMIAGRLGDEEIAALAAYFAQMDE